MIGYPRRLRDLFVKETGNPAMPKLIYVILDGLGDDPIPAFDGRTPLEAAATPVLDRLASRGSNGRVVTVREGVAPESDIAVFAILGYDPYAHHTGRGPIEAVGAGLAFEKGDLAYRVNFATVTRANDGWEIVDRRVGRDLSSDEAHALAAEVQDRVKVDGARFELRATVGHRGVVVFYPDGEPLSALVENSDPAYGREGLMGVAKETFDEKVVEVEPVAGSEEDDAAQRSASVTNEWLAATHDVLERSDVNRRRRERDRLPANFVLSRDGGDHLPEITSFEERFGLRMGCFVALPVEVGIARLTRMHEIDAPTEGTESDQYTSWAELAAGVAPDHDGLYIHLKGPDVPAHDGDHEAKMRSIEDIDRLFFDPLLEAIDLDSHVVAVTSDHSTSCPRKAHTDGPVPLLVAGAGIDSDSVSAYGERASRDGSLGMLQGRDIMPALVRMLGR
jgi:2,3-bisphosphoglycerate-independent phosphoglycerate mutase